jgi:L-asparagine transporter-like permease
MQYPKGIHSHHHYSLYNLFVGTELIGLAAAETAHPRKVLPDASKQVTWRIILFYFVSLLIVGFLVPYDDPNLLGGGINTSAFVVAISNAGVSGLPDFMNFIILISNLRLVTLARVRAGVKAKVRVRTGIKARVRTGIKARVEARVAIPNAWVSGLLTLTSIPNL